MKRFFLIFSFSLLLLGCQNDVPETEVNGPYVSKVNGSDTNEGMRLNKYLEEQALETLSAGSSYHCESYFFGADEAYYYMWTKCSEFSVVEDALVEKVDINGPVRVGYDDSDGITILSVESLTVNEAMQLSEDQLKSINQSLLEAAEKDLAIHREEAKGGILMDSWDFEVPQYQNGLMTLKTSEGYSYSTHDPLYWVAVPNSEAHGLVSSDGNYIIYYDSSDFTLHEYHLVTGEDEILMTFHSTVLSVDIKIRPDSRYVAVVANNDEDESYRDSRGTKLFLFSMDEEGKMLDRTDHAIIVQGMMSNEGSYSSKQGFYFNEEGDFVYLSYVEGYWDTSIQKILGL